MRAQLAEQVNVLRTAYAELDSFSKSVWCHVDESSRDVSRHAFDTLASVQHQDILRQRLEQVIGAIAILAKNDTALQDALLGRAPLPSGWKPLAPKELLGNYVMADQRDAHASALAESSTSTTTRSSVPPSPSSESRELAKIELF